VKSSLSSYSTNSSECNMNYGKHWGADDDLIILNVIENIFKSKTIQQHKLKPTKSLNDSVVNANGTEIDSFKNIQLLVQELQESQHLNVKLKQECNHLQTQLDNEQKWSHKLEMYIRKHFASSSTLLTLTNLKDMPINISLIDQLDEHNV